jgi:hypothetical protein
MGKGIAVLLGVCVVVAVGYSAAKREREGGSGGAAADFERDVYSKVSADAVEQYGIAKRQGDKVQICVQAGFVAAAFLQAKDEAQYRRWKDTEAADCAAAGMPK